RGPAGAAGGEEEGAQDEEGPPRPRRGFGLPAERRQPVGRHGEPGLEAGREPKPEDGLRRHQGSGPRGDGQAPWPGAYGDAARGGEDDGRPTVEPVAGDDARRPRPGDRRGASDRREHARDPAYRAPAAGETHAVARGELLRRDEDRRRRPQRGAR